MNFIKPFTANILKGVARFGIPFSPFSDSPTKSIQYLYHNRFLQEGEGPRFRTPEERATRSVRLIQTLDEIRLENPEQELSRLKENQRIFRSLAQVAKKRPDIGNRKNLLVPFGRSVELREILKDHYYVINHAQETGLVIGNIVRKKILQRSNRQNHFFFEPLRDPIPSDLDVPYFKRGLQTDHDDQYSEQLISGDIYLENTDRLESALDFFSRGRNMTSNPQFVSNILFGTLQRYLPEQQAAGEISKEIAGLSGSLRCETLYSICIPKDQLHRTGFLCRAFGTPELGRDPRILDDLQDGFQTGTSFGLNLQVRLLPLQFNPREVFIIPNSSVGTSELQEIEEKVEKILRKHL